jgi:hypothetical protein
MWTLQSYLRESREGRATALLVFPLFVLYEAGLILCTSGELRNAADVLLRDLLGALGRGGGLILNTAVLILIVVVALWPEGRRRIFSLLPLAGLVLLESSLYALMIVPVVNSVRGLAALEASPPAQGGVIDAVILGLGAGLYEEVVFRLIFVAGGYLLLRRVLGVDPIWAVVVPLILSSLAFSAFHHIGPFGEPWSAPVFVFRFLAGAVLGVLFVYRGFAVACWTHALYDTFLLLVLT